MGARKTPLSCRNSSLQPFLSQTEIGRREEGRYVKGKQVNRRKTETVKERRRIDGRDEDRFIESWEAATYVEKEKDRLDRKR